MKYGMSNKRSTTVPSTGMAHGPMGGSNSYRNRRIGKRQCCSHHTARVGRGSPTVLAAHVVYASSLPAAGLSTVARVALSQDNRPGRWPARRGSCLAAHSAVSRCRVATDRVHTPISLISNSCPAGGVLSQQVASTSITTIWSSCRATSSPPLKRVIAAIYPALPGKITWLTAAPIRRQARSAAPL